MGSHRLVRGAARAIVQRIAAASGKRSAVSLPGVRDWILADRRLDRGRTGRLRILIVNPSYPPVACGVGAYTRGLATALSSAGHEVRVVTGTHIAKDDGVPNVTPLLREWNVGEFLRARRHFAQPRPDCVVSNFPAIVPGRYHRLLYLVPLLAKATLGRPRTILILHEFARAGEITQALLSITLWSADRIVTVTEAERDAIVARYPSVAGRVVVRHNAPTIPVAADDPAADAQARAEYESDGAPVIAFVGTLHAGAAKGLDDLLRALARTDALLVVTGSLDPGIAYHAHIGRLIEEMGLSDRVRWLGFLSDGNLARMLRAVDAVVLPFQGGAESGYTSLLASLANGAAVITTRGPQNPPWLRDGETAVLVEAGDIDALASAINRLCSDAELAARVRDGARRVKFGWEPIVEAVVAPV